MEEYYKEILAFLGFTLAVYGFLIKFKESKIKGKELKTVKEENKQLKKKYFSSSMTIDLANLNAIREIVDMIFKDTHIDRFLLLSAVNGKESFNFVSALYEQHDVHKGGRLSLGATSKYVDIGTDDSYKEMLRKAEFIGPFVSPVHSMNDCLLKKIYYAEGIKHTGVFFLVRQPLDKENDRLVFVSWATHSDAPIDMNVELTLQGATNKIKHLIV